MSDPTGPGGVGTAQAERPSTRTARVGNSGSPVGSPLTIILAVVAVVVGFLIFRTIDSGGDGGTAGLPVDTSANTVATGATTPGGTTAATVAGAPASVAIETRTGATVVVINAGEVSGSAGAMTDLLTEKGYTTVDGVSDADDESTDATVVQFLDGTGNPAVEAVARTLAAALGGVDVEAVTVAPGVASGDNVGAATVFVLLGTDKANQPLGPDAPASPTAPAVASPAPTTAG